MIEYISFTEKGEGLAERLCAEYGGRLNERGPGFSLKKWTGDRFRKGNCLVYIGAVAIAVRAIAPFVYRKDQDPAVIVVDELGHYVIPILSGHIGGANAIARDLARITGGEAIVTTATDINGVFAIDVWARGQGLLIADTAGIRTVSSALLRGEKVLIRSIIPIRGQAPEGVVYEELPGLSGCRTFDLCPSAPGQDPAGKLHSLSASVRLDVRPDPEADLWLIPPILLVGIGCRRGTPLADIEAALLHAAKKYGIDERAIRAVSSIDLKAHEPGLVDYAAGKGLETYFFSSEELMSIDGVYTASYFVEAVTGVDNVCERSAVLACQRIFGKPGRLICQKQKYPGVTIALAMADGITYEF